MAYEWELGEPVPDGIKRIIREEVESSLYNLRDNTENRDEAAHEVRKSFKKIRAVLRLVRDELGEAEFQKQNSLYRDLGRELAPVRDAFVIVESLDAIRAELNNAKLKRAATAIRKDLHAKYLDLHSAFWNSDTVPHVIIALEDSLPEIENLPIKTDSFKALKGGLSRVYRRGRKRMRIAYANIPSSESFHDWRKRVKYLWYQMTILQPIYPAKIVPLVAQLDELSDLLGLAQDYAVLYKHVAVHPKASNGHGRQVLAFIDYKRGELEASAKPFGEAIYNMKGKKFVKQVKKWWDNPKPVLA